jgi:hypothetical protein
LFKAPLKALNISQLQAAQNSSSVDGGVDHAILTICEPSSLSVPASQ